MDYLKKSLRKLNIKSDYEEVDTKLASGWYVDSLEVNKKKKYKTKKVEFKIMLAFCNVLFELRSKNNCHPFEPQVFFGTHYIDFDRKY